MKPVPLLALAGLLTAAASRAANPIITDAFTADPAPLGPPKSTGSIIGRQ